MESFDAICAGTADPAGLAVLGAGQRSKHLLLLRLVAERLPTDLRRSGTVVAESLELLEHVRTRYQPAFDRLISYPYLGAGLVQCLHRLKENGESEPAVRLLATAAAAAAITAGCDFTLDRVPVASLLHLPGLGSARLDPAQRAVQLAGDAGRISLGGVTVPDNLQREAANWIPVRRLTDSIADRLPPVFDDLDPGRRIGGLPIAPRVAPGAFGAWRDSFHTASQRLHDLHPSRAAQVKNVLRVITPLAILRRGQGRSASFWQAYGAVAVTFPRDSVGLAATLVHETQHSVLNGLQDLVDLCDPADPTLYYSPWRADPRPLRGLLHGCYAFLGVADFWARERVGASGSRRADFEFARVSVQVRQALETLHGAPGLTADGRHLVARLTEHAQRLGTPMLPEPVRHLAGLANEDHRVSWRLRVVVPDPGIVDAAARAWRAGHPTPPLPSAYRLAPSTETFLPNERISQLGRLARREERAANGAEPGMASDADDRLARREYRAAACGYRDAVHRSADDMAAWTGLALAGARLGGPGAHVWRQRPELVRALYRALDVPASQPPDPLSLAGWLAGGLHV